MIGQIWVTVLDLYKGGIRSVHRLHRVFGNSDKKPDLNRKLQRWTSMLGDYTLTLHHKPSKTNPVDCLSRIKKHNKAFSRY